MQFTDNSVVFLLLATFLLTLKGVPGPAVSTRYPCCQVGCDCRDNADRTVMDCNPVDSLPVCPAGSIEPNFTVKELQLWFNTTVTDKEVSLASWGPGAMLNNLKNTSFVKIRSEHPTCGRITLKDDAFSEAANLETVALEALCGGNINATVIKNIPSSAPLETIIIKNDMSVNKIDAAMYEGRTGLKTVEFEALNLTSADVINQTPASVVELVLNYNYFHVSSSDIANITSRQLKTFTIEGANMTVDCDVVGLIHNADPYNIYYDQGFYWNFPCVEGDEESSPAPGGAACDSCCPDDGGSSSPPSL